MHHLNCNLIKDVHLIFALFISVQEFRYSEESLVLHELQYVICIRFTKLLTYPNSFNLLPKAHAVDVTVQTNLRKSNQIWHFSSILNIFIQAGSLKMSYPLFILEDHLWYIVNKTRSHGLKITCLQQYWRQNTQYYIVYTIYDRVRVRGLDTLTNTKTKVKSKNVVWWCILRILIFIMIRYSIYGTFYICYVNFIFYSKSFNFWNLFEYYI